jgi:hypothetical protein
VAAPRLRKTAHSLSVQGENQNRSRTHEEIACAQEPLCRPGARAELKRRDWPVIPAGFTQLEREQHAALSALAFVQTGQLAFMSLVV